MIHLGKVTAAALASAVAGFVFGAENAAAAEGGTFRLLVSVVHDYTTIDHAGGRVTAGGSTGTGTVLQSSGGAFAEGGTHLVTCLAYATITEAGTDIRGACTMTDATGDRWFALAKRDAGDIEEGSGGGGRWELVGGTGRYAGVRGSCPYAVEYLPGNHLVSTADCTWKN